MSKDKKQEIINYAQKLVKYGFSSGTSGNISIFDVAKKQVIITPSGFDFQEMTINDLMTINLNGQIISGNNKISSEWEMHTLLYKNRPDLKAIIHVHSTYATVLSCLGLDLPATHYMIAVAGKNVRVSEYATFGTKEIAHNVVKGMTNRTATMLANHGLIGGESTLAKAFNVIEEVEYCAKIYCLAKTIGKPNILSDQEMDVMAKKFQDYGKNNK